MVFRDTPWPEGTPCWVDAMVPDVQRAKAFYSALLGWRLDDQGSEFAHYQIAKVDGRSVAAISPKPSETAEMPAVWTTYLAVTDVDKMAAKVTEAGGQLLMPPDDVGNKGRVAIAADPSGAVFGLWQAGEITGVRISDVPGALVWNECMTSDFEGGKAFYAEVFGYHVEDMSSAEFSYATLKLNDRPSCGLGALPAEVPSHWSVYFGVSDTDSAVAKIRELGGTLNGEPHDSPYGRMAEVADDQGVPFNIISVHGG
ncbi:VOC family protein [Amycolatopsis taiwanensis]|uniref:VOC family protein n=1 Tax=Amycolatopsis taiwanensis TaxID=342230 RepID=UPI000486AC19|nr:VOC family protein [Amycolatopsis taiwanensis]